jgi:hypothetical protein
MEGAVEERLAIVTYEVRRRAQHAGLGFGYLIETPDGRAWCFPSRETRMQFPGEEEAFELNPERLKEDADSDSGRRAYIYSLVQ